MRGAALIAAGWLLFAQPAQADSGPPLLDGLFGDHAVFQRERPIPIWGEAKPGETVTIRFAGAETEARADRSGRWRATLPAQSAGGPFSLTASSSGGARMTIADILVGDVWLCSGQSNMELEVARALDSRSVIAGAGDDGIRLLTVAHDTSFVPLDRFQTAVEWQPVNPATVRDFSAACYFMGRDLRASRKVPIGLIDASWGGTAIDAWRSEQAIEASGEAADRLATLRAYRADPVAGNRRWGALWEDWWRSRSSDEPWRDESASQIDWTPVPGFTAWESWGVPALESFNGMVWYRTTIRLTPEQAGQPATLSVGWVDEIDQSWVNGVPVGNSYGPNAERFYGIPPGVLKAGENSITVAALDSYGAGGMTGPDALRQIRFGDGSAVPLGTDWRYSIAPAGIGLPPRAPWESNAGLSTIYNGMIAPIGGYGLRGVAWYQGESDAGASARYADKLASMMRDWRGQLGAPELPFLIVQLSGWGAPATAPRDSGFAEIREAQRRAVAADPNAALIVTIDVGDRVDIHPANKQAVGKRLARAARHVAYGDPAAPSGPEAASVRRTGEGVLVTFEGVEGDLVTYSSDRAIGFELCGADVASCRFVLGEARGSGVMLAAPGFAADRVRFCWGDSPLCNLSDGSGLPAGPFEMEIR